MTPGDDRVRHARLLRWERLQIKVRCALQPDDPACLGQFITTAARLVADDVLPEWPTHEHCFGLLMNTAEDSALPLHWRWMCIDFACRPLARLTTLALNDRRLRRRLVGHAGRLARAEVRCTTPPTRL